MIDQNEEFQENYVRGQSTPRIEDSRQEDEYCDDIGDEENTLVQKIPQVEKAPKDSFVKTKESPAKLRKLSDELL